MEAGVTDSLTAQARAIWETALDVEVGSETDFFDVGGDSLTAMRIIAAVDDISGTRLSLRVLLDNSRFDTFMAALRLEILRVREG